jgi:hypothetical protein
MRHFISSDLMNKGLIMLPGSGPFGGQESVSPCGGPEGSPQGAKMIVLVLRGGDGYDGKESPLPMDKLAEGGNHEKEEHKEVLNKKVHKDDKKDDLSKKIDKSMRFFVRG